MFFTSPDVRLSESLSPSKLRLAKIFWVNLRLLNLDGPRSMTDFGLVEQSSWLSPTSRLDGKLCDMKDTHEPGLIEHLHI